MDRQKSLSLLLHVGKRKTGTNDAYQGCEYLAFIELDMQQIMLMRARRRCYDFRNYVTEDTEASLLVFDYHGDWRSTSDHVPHVFKISESFLIALCCRGGSNVAERFKEWMCDLHNPFWLYDFKSSMIGDYELPTSMAISSAGVCWNWSDDEFDYMTSLLTPEILEVSHTYRVSGVEAAVERLTSFSENSNNFNLGDVE